MIFPPFPDQFVPAPTAQVERLGGALRRAAAARRQRDLGDAQRRAGPRRRRRRRCQAATGGVGPGNGEISGVFSEDFASELSDFSCRIFRKK